MSYRTNTAEAAAIQWSRWRLNSIWSTFGTLLWALSFAMPISPGAVANDLTPVEDALVLYFGQDITKGGGEIIRSIRQTISPTVLGETPLRELTSDQQSLVLFRDAYPHVFCMAAWPGSFDLQENSFFHHVGEYGIGRNPPHICQDAPVTETVHRQGEVSATVSLRIPDPGEPHWTGFRLKLAIAFGRIAAREDEPYAVSVLICPRILQIRTPARAAVRMQRHVRRINDFIEAAVVGKTDLRSGRPLRLMPVILGEPTVSSLIGPAEFALGDQREENMFDIYLRVPRPDGREDGSGRPEFVAEDCLSRGTADRPQARDATLRIPRSLRFVWTDRGSYEIFRAFNDTLVRTTLRQWAGLALRAAPGIVHAPDADVTPPGVWASGGTEPETGDDTFEPWYVIEGYEDPTPRKDLSVTVEETRLARRRAEAVRALFREDVKVAITGFGRVSDFNEFGDIPTIVVSGDGSLVAGEELLASKHEAHNRTAFVTMLYVPKTASEDRMSLVRGDSVLNALRLTAVRAVARRECVSTVRFNETREQLESYLTYFLGRDYAHFKTLPEHQQSVILICRGHGGTRDLTSGRLGPVLLRALEDRFKGKPTEVRATHLHQIGEGTARRYYLFGHSILTHFQRGTMAGTLQSGTDAAGNRSYSGKRKGVEGKITPLCDEFPGLRIVQKAENDDIDLCARDERGSFLVDDNTRVDRTLYHLVLPTTMAEHLACAPKTTVHQRVSPATDTTSAVTEDYLKLGPPSLGCGAADLLPDPYALLMKLRDRTYVFRAAIDVAYEFTRR